MDRLSQIRSPRSGAPQVSTPVRPQVDHRKGPTTETRLSSVRPHRLGSYMFWTRAAGRTNSPGETARTI